MSHSEGSNVCPNCGYHAERNYCAQCGQPTHLHKETFWGLISHFVGHYFHYDSKFWQTLKALWFSPGKLTTAYINKQRARYIPPISLYIFISVAFFLASSLMMHAGSVEVKVNEQPATHETIKQPTPQTKTADNNSVFSAIRKSLSETRQNMDASDKKSDEVTEKMIHTIPKVFFFMIPLMGLVLKLLFVRRKDVYFVDHAIFALNYHSLWFSVMFLGVVYPFDAGSDVINGLLMLAASFYFVVALKNVYNIGWIKSLLFSIITALIYMVFILVSVAVLLTIIAH